MQPPLFQRSSRFGYRRWRRSGWLLFRLAPDTPHKARDGCDPACRRSSTSRDSRKVCCAAADLSDRTPLASCAQNIHDPVHHFAHLDMALVAAALGGRNQWFDMRPFIVGQVTRISQFAAVVTSSVLRRPHTVVPLSNQVTTLNHKRFKGFKMFSDGH